MGVNNNKRKTKFREGSQVRQTPEEGRRTYRPKHCGNNNKDEDNSPKTLNEKNQLASSQKFKQLKEKQDNIKKASLHNKRNQINTNVQKLKKAL